MANLAGPRLINRHSVPELTDPATVVSPPRRLVSSLPFITLNRQHRSLIGYEEPRGWLGGRLDRKAVAQQLRAQQCVENYGAPSPLGIPQSETELPVAPCNTRVLFSQGRLGRKTRHVYPPASACKQRFTGSLQFESLRDVAGSL